VNEAGGGAALERPVILPTGPGGRSTARRTDAFIARGVRAIGLACVRPFGYLAFAIALAALSASAKLLGEEHELGFFAGRLNGMIRRYPEVTRRGVQMAWVAWAVLFGITLSSIDPIASHWDEVALGALAFGVLWRRTVGGRRAGR
jgi:hypothetical protein